MAHLSLTTVVTSFAPSVVREAKTVGGKCDFASTLRFIVESLLPTFSEAGGAVWMACGVVPAVELRDEAEREDRVRVSVELGAGPLSCVGKTLLTLFFLG